MVLSPLAHRHHQPASIPQSRTCRCTAQPVWTPVKSVSTIVAVCATHTQAGRVAECFSIVAAVVAVPVSNVIRQQVLAAAVGVGEMHIPARPLIGESLVLAGIGSFAGVACAYKCLHTVVLQPSKTVGHAGRTGQVATRAVPPLAASGCVKDGAGRHLLRHTNAWQTEWSYCCHRFQARTGCCRRHDNQTGTKLRSRSPRCCCTPPSNCKV